MIDIVVYIRG